MGLRNNCYAKVWSARKVGKTYSVQTSVSKLVSQETGEYQNQFSGFVTFAGDAAKKIEDLRLPERMDKDNPQYRSIHILSTDITTYYNKKFIDKMISLADGNEELVGFIRRNASPPSVTVWDFEIPDDNDRRPARNSNRQVQQRRNSEPVVEEDDDSDLPF